MPADIGLVRGPECSVGPGQSFAQSGVLVRELSNALVGDLQASVEGRARCLGGGSRCCGSGGRFALMEEIQQVWLRVQPGAWHSGGPGKLGDGGCPPGFANSCHGFRGAGPCFL